MMVAEELNRLRIPFKAIDLGVVELLHPLSKKQHDLLNVNLQESGLEVLDDKRAIVVEGIKNAIVELIHSEDMENHSKISEIISHKLNLNYTYLADMFSEVKGMTIQQYVILNKIERVKELLLYDELSLSEISYQMHYSSVAHLSGQFKKVTGLTPTFYKTMARKRRKNLEDLWIVQSFSFFM